MTDSPADGRPQTTRTKGTRHLMNLNGRVAIVTGGGGPVPDALIAASRAPSVGPELQSYGIPAPQVRS